MVAAAQGVAGGLTTAARHGWNVLTHPGSPVRMAGRVRLLDSVDLNRDLERLNVPTLVVTGEDALDDVVAPAITREYLAMWPHAASAVLARTGHLGIITRPD